MHEASLMATSLADIKPFSAIMSTYELLKTGITGLLNFFYQIINTLDKRYM